MKHHLDVGLATGERVARYFCYCDAHSLVHVNDPRMLTGGPIRAPTWIGPIATASWRKQNTNLIVTLTEVPRRTA